MSRRNFVLSLMLLLLVSISLAPTVAQERTQVQFWDVGRRATPAGCHPRRPCGSLQRIPRINSSW